MPPSDPGVRAAERHVPEHEDGDVSPLAVAPVPIRLTGRQFITVKQIAQFLRRRDVHLQPSDLACQFDSEDGSDRMAWALPRQQLDGFSDDESAERDRVLRRVL